MTSNPRLEIHTWLISIEPLASKNLTNLQFRRNPEGNGWLAVCRRRMQQYSWSRSWIFLVHASPKNKSDRDKWVRFVRTYRANFSPLGRFMVYSEHFDKDCFERGHYVEGSLRTLRSGSVSTIWLQKTAQEPPSSRSERKRKRVSRHVLLASILHRLCSYISKFTTLSYLGGQRLTFLYWEQDIVCW